MATQELIQFSNHTPVAATYLVGQDADTSGGRFTVAAMMAAVGNGLYLLVDGSNASANIDISSYDFTTTGDGAFGTLTLANCVVATDFVFGSDQLIDSGDVSQDARFFFDKSKATFCAGKVTSTHWDAIGVYSALFGEDNRSTADDSIQAGYSHVQDGDWSAQFGYDNIQNGDYGLQAGSVLSDAGYDNAYMFGASKTAIVGSAAYFWVDNGLRLKPVAGDAGTPENGTMCYNLTTHEFRGYANGGWVSMTGPWSLTGTVVHNREGLDTNDFVFGSDVLNDDGDSDHDNRFLFDKSEGAFYAGGATSTEWNSRGVHSATFGLDNSNTGAYCVSSGYGSSNTLQGAKTHAAGKFALGGDAQTRKLIARGSIFHTGADWYELFLDGASAQLLINADTVWTFDIKIVGTTQGCVKSFGFKIDGVIERDGGTTSILASNVTTLYDTDDSDFDARVRADNTNNALAIEVRDSTSGGDTVRWVAVVETAEVTYPE